MQRLSSDWPDPEGEEGWAVRGAAAVSVGSDIRESGATGDEELAGLRK
jgi:hypothetical protein